MPFLDDQHFFLNLRLIYASMLISPRDQKYMLSSAYQGMFIRRYPVFFALRELVFWADSELTVSHGFTLTICVWRCTIFFQVTFASRPVSMYFEILQKKKKHFLKVFFFLFSFIGKIYQ